MHVAAKKWLRRATVSNFPRLPVNRTSGASQRATPPLETGYRWIRRSPRLRESRYDEWLSRPDRISAKAEGRWLSLSFFLGYRSVRNTRKNTMAVHPPREFMARSLNQTGQFRVDVFKYKAVAKGLRERYETKITFRRLFLKIFLLFHLRGDIINRSFEVSRVENNIEWPSFSCSQSCDFFDNIKWPFGFSVTTLY